MSEYEEAVARAIYEEDPSENVDYKNPNIAPVTVTWEELNEEEDEDKWFSRKFFRRLARVAVRTYEIKQLEEIK